MIQKNAPTMKDVAKEAGVALGTVSKVINGIPVRKSSKIKVDLAIKKLNYQVNTYARGLKTSKTQTLTLIVPSLKLPFYSNFTYEIEQQAYKRGYKLILCCSNGIPEKELDYLSLAAQSKTDGIIALTYTDISERIPENIPLIVFDRQLENHSVPRIASDNYEGSMLAVQKLLEFGCKSPVFIGFHSEFPGEADKRFDGYLDACKKYHLTPRYLYEADIENRLEAMCEFMKQYENSGSHTLNFDGIVANTDYHACIAIQALNALGYQVPADVQVIGFDGTKKFYPSNEYMVSTIRQPLPDLAEKIVSMVLDAENSALPTLTLFPVTYEYGGTTIR